MTVDITQDEMNILNKNGISAEEIRSNVEYMRATGVDDKAIRQQYTDILGELRPLTKQSYNDTGKIKDWQSKGGITPFEYAQRKAVEFGGEYGNIDNNANLNLLEQKLKNSPRNIAVEEKIAKNLQEKAERNKRVNEGTASFLDRANAALDRMANASYQAQVNAPDDVVIKMLGVNNSSDKSGKINFSESLGNSFITGDWIPFVGGFIKGADDKKEREIRQHILNGEPIRQDELNYLNNRLEQRQEEAVRGYTWGGHVANGFLPSLIRFSGEIYTGGWVLKGLGLVGEVPASATLGTKALNALGNMGKYGAVGAVLPTGWNDTYQNFQERLLNNGFEFTDKGSYIFKENSEKPAISFLKSLGQTFVMFASESSGELLHIPIQGAAGVAGKYLGTPISKYIMAQPKIAKFVNKVLPELSKYYEKMNKLKPKGAAWEFLKDSVKFDGLLEEMGEEVVEDVLNLTLGTTDEKRTLENYAKAVFKSPDEWAIIAGAIALQGGTLSAASHTLGSYMEKNGASEEEILEVMQELSEKEKEQKISELAAEGLIDVSKYTNADLDARANLKNKYFTQLKNAGKQDDAAIQEATLMSEIIADSAKKWGINLDDAEKKFAITLQNMSDEEAIKQWQSDNATALQGKVVFNANKTIENKLNQIYDEYDKLPEDFSDMDVINKYIDDMQTLESIKDGTIEDIEKVQNLIKEYEQSDPDLASALKDAMQGGIKLHTQKIDNDNIEKNFGDTAENITENIKADILNILEENGLDESEFKLEDIRIYGSYSTGKNKETSDLDFIVQYSGPMREDDAFNMLNDEKLTIEDVNGRTVEIDINPINVEKSGTIDENLEYFDSLQPKFQSIESAGAEKNKTALAKQEWKKKGIKSRFFKKWFGNSKVVDESGKPLVVYHGSRYKFDTFKHIDGLYSDKDAYNTKNAFFFTDNDEIAEKFAEIQRENQIQKLQAEKNFGSGYNNLTEKERLNKEIKENTYNDNIRYDVYLSIQNPYIVDFQEKEYSTFEIDKIIKHAQENNFDGVIINNILDEGGIGNQYAVFNPEQIKSVNNQGTFDENNHNIYFQGNKKSPMDYDYINNQTTGEKINIEMNEDIKVNKIEPQKISLKSHFVISEKPSINKKELIKNLDLINGKKIEAENQNTRETAFITKDTVKKSLSNLSRYDKNYFDKIAILYNIESIFKTSQLILSHKDTKTDTNMQIKRYANVVSTNNGNYLLEIVGKNNNELTIYSINPIDTKNDGNQKRLEESRQLEAINNSITNIQHIFKSKLVEKYNNDYKTQNKQRSDIHFQRRKNIESPGQMKLFQEALQMNLFQQEKIFKSENASGQNIESEIKEEYTKKEIEEAKEKESDAINDVGDSLLGNLKRNKKQYTWQELEKMNELLRKKYLAKNYIYQLDSYDDFKKQGLSDKCIAFIYNVYSKINAKPAKGYDGTQEQKIYFDFIHEVMNKTIEFTKANQELIDNHAFGTDNSLFKNIFPDTENKKAFNIFRAYPEYNKKVIIAGGNKLIGALYLDYETEKNIKKILPKFRKDIETNTEKKETLSGWRKIFDVAESCRGWFVADKKSGLILSSKELPSKEIAQALAEKMYEFISQNKKGYEVDFSNLRNYLPRRKDNQNVNPEALIEVFGFRGINFGNWTKQNERQNFVNLAYDSLYDLAEILNLPPKALSLGGKLGLAFGAQGRSGAAGHFIAEYNEINLTRKSGAGALAHEWWHALDYYFGDQSTGKEFSGKDSLSLKQQGFLREEIYAALQNINEQIKFSPLTEKELEEKKNTYSERIKNGINYYAKDIKAAFAKSKNIEAINSFVENIVNNAETISLKDDNFDALTKQFNDLLDERRRTFANLNKMYQLLHQVERLQKVEDMAKSSRKYTDYYTKAEKLNVIEKGHGTNYWTRNTELGARAFASYILDKMNQKEMQNNFLVRDENLEYSFDMSVVSEILNANINKTETEKNMQDSIVQWYPAEPEERKRIFAAFDNLFKKVKTREENNRLILFQSMGNENLRSDIENARGFTYQRFNFDGTVKDNLITLLNNKADKSTLIHEFAHVYLTTLNNMARENERAKSMLLTVNKWLRYDGIEYTTAQHEKFANSFVAYVRSGKAPTYGLKLAFENFRKWLNDLYNTLTNNDDLFIDQETEKVFEELLGDISINAQKKAANDIIDRAKRYAELRFNDEGIKNEVDQNKLTDTQRRYRDTAYDIIYYALSHSKKAKNFIKSRQQLVMILGNRNKAVDKRNIGIKTQAERIFEILSELEDEFSANDGFLSEWGEFFADPGISYDNKELGADAELAMEAYNVIVENRYLYDKREDFGEYGILTDEEVQKNEYELEFILNEYRDAQDKTIPLFAFYEWHNDLHPYIQEELAKKWEARTNEIERYQALSKFDQAKEDLKIYAATLKGQGDYSTQFAEYARAILKRLDFMTELDKAKIFNKLKDFNSFREIERNLDDVMDYAETIAAVSERKQLADDIDREVRQTIHEWKNGIKKTKYTYPANKLFTRLREISKMKQEEVQELYDEIVNDEGEISYEADTLNNKDYYTAIERMFVKFKANGSYYNSTEFLTDLLDRIQGAKFTAKLARDEIDFERRMEQINLIDECARAVDEHKGKVSGIEKAYRHAFNLNSALEMMFNKAIKNKFSLDYLYAQRDAKTGKDRNEVLEKLAKVYGFSGKFRDIQLFNKFIDMTKKEFKIKQRYTPDKVNGTYRITHTDKESGKTFTDRIINLIKNENRKEWEDEPIELSRMELLYYYIQAKNPISYNMLTHMGDETTPAKGQFDKLEFDNLLKNLTEQEKLMGDILQMAAEKYYPELNKYHIKKYHTDLGRVSCYFPRKSETQEVKMLEMFNQYASLNTNQKFQKQRTAGPGIRIAPANPIAVLFEHIEKSNTLIIMGEQLDLMNSVFKDGDLTRKIKAIWGDETANEFMQLVTSNLYSGQMSAISEAESFIGSISNNVIKSQIFLKPQVGLKQMLSFMNYGIGDDYVTSKEWLKKFAAQTFTPFEWKNNIKYMLDIPYLKDRFSRGGSTDALKRQLEQRLFAKISLFDDILSANVRYGDIGAIILGGKPYIDCLIDKGYSKEQAIKIFIEKTVNDQQSSIPSTLSNIQRNAARQPLAKMFFAYQNTPWQYFRTASNAIIRFKQNPDKQTGIDMVKLTGLYLFVFPLIFNMASSLSPLILVTGGGDDDLKSDFWKSVIGGITFIPLGGMFINAIYSGFRGEKASGGNWFETAAAKMGKTARHISKGEVTPLDIFQAISLFTEAATGLPFTTAGTELSGAWDILTGEITKGALKVGGYTDYRAKKVTGQQD